MSRVRFRARLRLLPTGGRTRPVLDDDRASWELKNTWLGQPTLNDARVRLDGITEIAPGDEGPVIIEPLVAEVWGAVDIGAVLPVQEGRRIVGHATVTEVSRAEHFTRETAAFADQARQYCHFIEHAATFPLGDRLAAARTRLLELYSAGLLLPRVEPPARFDAGATPPRPAGWEGFDRFEFYRDVFDPYVDEEPCAGSLSDDLLDVYLDARRGLDLWDSKAPLGAAVWEWRFALDSHWGDHAVDALRALHRACRAP